MTSDGYVGYADKFVCLVAEEYYSLRVNAPEDSEREHKILLAKAKQIVTNKLKKSSKHRLKSDGNGIPFRLEDADSIQLEKLIKWAIEKGMKEDRDIYLKELVYEKRSRTELGRELWGISDIDKLLT